MNGAEEKKGKMQNKVKELVSLLCIWNILLPFLLSEKHRELPILIMVILVNVVEVKFLMLVDLFGNLFSMSFQLLSISLQLNLTIFAAWGKWSIDVLFYSPARDPPGRLFDLFV